MKPILKGGIRILRPQEYEALRDAIPRVEHQVLLDTALLTGMRWGELQRFSAHAEWYDPRGGYIYLPPEASRKRTRKMRERYVYLSSRGRAIVPLFLKMRVPVPHRVTWNEDLRRWARSAGLDPTGLSAEDVKRIKEYTAGWGPQ